MEEKIIRSEEWKRGQRLSHLGQISGFKGKKMTDEQKEKIRKAHMGKKHSEKTKRKMTLSRTGVPVPRKGKPALWKRGVNSNFWKGGITLINFKIKNSFEYRLWRETVFIRDNWIDQKTGIRGGKLAVHHILNFSSHPELRFAIDNGVTLSQKSHREFHRKYGIKNNTREQLLEFLDTI